jgi:DNA replication protein
LLISNSIASQTCNRRFTFRRKTAVPQEPPVSRHAVPAETLTNLIRDVWDPLEAKVILAVAALGGEQSPVAEQSLIKDADLLLGLRSDGSSRPAVERVREAAGAAIVRGGLIALGGTEGERWYVLGTAANRQRARDGEFSEPGASTAVPLPMERPGIFAIYEQNIGLMTPIIADKLADALMHYPESWIEDAIGESVAYNRRSWRYVERILETWSTEGRSNEANRRDHEEHHDSKTSLRERYAPFLRKR